MPTISVIVPVYKVEPYLRECVDSILGQSYGDFELILVDDGSPDNCGAICDDYAVRDARVRVIHQKNGGLSAARNAGLDIASGEYVTFIDSDDVVHTAYLSHLLRGLTEHKADICICQFLRFAGEKPVSNAIDGTVKVSIDGRTACYALYDDNAVTYTIACAKLYAMRLFEGIRYPVGRIHEDEAITYKLLYRSEKVIELGDALYFYRQNPNGIMNVRFSPKRYEAIMAFDERITFFRKHGEQELVALSEKALPVAVAKLAIYAAHAGVEKDIPLQYQMSVSKALRIIRKSSSNDNYTYYLSMVHPNWLRPHAYLRKIKEMLHIPCK